MTKAKAPLISPPADPPARKQWRRDREGKEQALIMAFDRLMRSGGSSAIGANAVIKEAGVGKNLLYSYFGSLGDLAKAWAEAGDFMPSEDEVTGGSANQKNRPLPDSIAGNYKRYAAALRKRPELLEVLSTELMHPNEVTEAIRDVRKDFGLRLHSYFPRSLDTEGEDVVALLIFLYAAVTYMALRSAHTPEYFFLDLSREEDWARVDSMLDLIVSRVFGAHGSPKAQASPQAAPQDAEL